MSLQGTVHMPAKPDLFEFDKEVADAFPDMARRSIPLYERGLAYAATLLVSLGDTASRVLDVGASHGEFFYTLERYLPQGQSLSKVYSCVALEPSPHMAAAFAKRYPHIPVVRDTIQEVDVTPDEYADHADRFDFIMCYHTLQFVPPEHLHRAIKKLAALLDESGILVAGIKVATPGVAVQRHINEQYYRFRLCNGYTADEIAAKNRALAHSMWPLDNDTFLRSCAAHGLSGAVVLASAPFYVYLFQKVS